MLGRVRPRQQGLSSAHQRLRSLQGPSPRWSLADLQPPVQPHLRVSRLRHPPSIRGAQHRSHPPREARVPLEATVRNALQRRRQRILVIQHHKRTIMSPEHCLLSVSTRLMMSSVRLLHSRFQTHHQYTRHLYTRAAGKLHLLLVRGRERTQGDLHYSTKQARKSSD